MWKPSKRDDNRFLLSYTSDYIFIHYTLCITLDTHRTTQIWGERCLYGFRLSRAHSVPLIHGNKIAFAGELILLLLCILR